MKKVFSICLAVVLLVTMSVTAFAADGAFTESPSAQPAPVVVHFAAASDECTAEIVITPFSDIDELSPEAAAALEAARQELAGAEDLTAVCEQLAELAKTLGVPGDRLAVVHLFDISFTGTCRHGEGEKHGPFTISLESEALGNFFALLHRHGDWHVVENAEVVDGELTFTTDELSPFAIVVDTNPAADAETSGNSMTYVIGALVVVVIGGIVVAMKKNKKEEAVK